MSALGMTLEELEVGTARERHYTVTEDVILAFAAVSGDRNPVHLDEAYAQETRFKGRIAHGMLSAAYISAVLGMDLPGPGAVYLSQTLAFKRPVRIGDEVTARAEVTRLDAETGQVHLRTLCTVRGKAVLEGDAVVLAPRRGTPAA